MNTEKIILVTGAASGIGLQIAKQFVEDGAVVIAVDINESLLNENAKELGSNYQLQVLNLCDAEAIAAVTVDIANKYERLDSLINNAGIIEHSEPEYLTSEHFDREIAVNLKAPMLLVKHLTPILRKSDNASVVNICSIASICEVSGHFLYSAAKAGLSKFTKDCTRSVHGIRHNNILPGLIDTPMFDTIGEEAANAIRKGAVAAAPAGRLGDPADIAHAVQFLCSDKATFINGATLSVDGGIIANNSSPI